MVRHLVLLRWAADTDETTQAEVIEGIASLRHSVPEVVDLRLGTDFAHRGSFDVGVSVDFRSRDGLAAYLAHPEHCRIVAELIQPHVAPEGLEIVDFEV